MKTISLELSKKLNEGGYLDGIETEYTYYSYKEENNKVINNMGKSKYMFVKGQIFNITEKYKTLTLEEAIEFLSIIEHEGKLNINFNKKDNIDITYMAFQRNGHMTIDEQFLNTYVNISEIITGKTLLEAIEKMIEYLLDNNLLGQKQEKN